LRICEPAARRKQAQELFLSTLRGGVRARHAHSRVERDKNLTPNGPRAAREIGDANEIELWDCASRIGLPRTFTGHREGRRMRKRWKNLKLQIDLVLSAAKSAPLNDGTNTGD
jgi:hypothetical protein